MYLKRDQRAAKSALANRAPAVKPQPPVRTEAEKAASWYPNRKPAMPPNKNTPPQRRK